MTSGDINPPPRRTIRSFVLRGGRLTVAQKKALETLWPEFGIDQSCEPLDLAREFGREAPTIMEIGFGNGDSLVAMAANDPDSNFIGVEVHEPGMGHCLLALAQRKLSNVRIIRGDAVEVLRNQVVDGALSGVNLFFPDPWPKKRHHKRRIVQPDFIVLIQRKLVPGGIFRAVTDWADYAEQIEAIVSANGAFEPVGIGGSVRPQTKFEQRGKRLGHEIADLIFQRN